VEQNIVRAAAARDTGRAEPRVGTPSDTLPRAVPLGDVGSWPLQPEPMPVPTPAPVARNFRSPTDEPWIAPEPPVRPREPSLPPDLTAKLGADLGIPPARTMAPPAGTPMRESAADASSAPQTDRNLAEMAQRLEAALRRPNAGEPHPPVTDPLAGGFVPPVAKPARQEPRFEPRPDMAAKPEPKLDTKPAPAKSAYDSLEQEMASLLGRPSGKT
ncbi:MAG: hypothetical protein JO237_00325, partial [Pseudolabrys sp.]|nr:hypothetical protein [Pseudolabrys sp.]